ncbi:MAG: hypothetical protein ACRD1V_14530 [Vicinamibacterales bacterium]
MTTCRSWSLTNCDFSPVRNYVNLIARTYLADVPDPGLERTKSDRDPLMTRRLVAALQALAKSTVEDSLMYPDAVEPAGTAEIQDFLKHAGPFGFAGRGSVAARD